MELRCELAQAEREARKQAVLERIGRWLDEAPEFEMHETASTRSCLPSPGNDHSTYEPDGGLQITLKIPRFTGDGPDFWRVGRNQYRVDQPTALAAKTRPSAA